MLLPIFYYVVLHACLSFEEVSAFVFVLLDWMSNSMALLFSKEVLDAGRAESGWRLACRMVISYILDG